MNKINFIIDWVTVIENENDDNVDIFVTFSNHEKYVATFFTYKNIKSLIEKNKKTGECLSGTYFWSTDMILIENLEIETIEIVIKELIDNDYFSEAFSLIGNGTD